MPHDVNQMLVNAMRCLTAADVIVGSAEFRADHLPFLLPLTLTIGNGLELLFKYNLVRQGQSCSATTSLAGAGNHLGRWG